MTTRELLRRLKKALEAKHIRLAYLFGSYAEGNAASMSDIDVAVLLEGEGRNLSQAYRKTMLAVMDALGSERFDLLLLNNAPLALQFQVISERRTLYARDEQVLNDFEMAVIRKFQDTSRLRKVQERYVRERAREWYSRKTA